MPISYAEHVPLTCPRCGTEWSTEIYVIVDAAERPELVSRVVDDSLHDSRCPQCGQGGRVPAPLLYHDSRNARVLLAVPPDMPESEWREVGQNLLWTLIGALPEEARLPYLGDVQAEAGLAGIGQVIQRERLTGSGAEDDADLPPIVIAIQSLLDSNGPADLMAAFNQHAILREPQAVTIMQELAAEAIRHGQPEAADGFARAAELLEQVKAMRAEAGAPMISIAVEGQRLTPEVIENLAFTLLRATTGQELAQAVDDHPELLDDATDAPLAAYAIEARREGKTRIADGLDERLTAIRAMRSQYREQQPILDAVQAYLDADSPESIEAIVLEREELTTDAADQALTRLADSARADGDSQLAAFVEERRGFLREVRAALDEAPTD
jgi:hypothetical protein